jgi:hypothetical protein
MMVKPATNFIKVEYCRFLEIGGYCSNAYHEEDDGSRRPCRCNWNPKSHASKCPFFEIDINKLVN